MQAGIVHDAATARDYLEQMLRNVFLYGDLLLARLAWDITEQGDRNESSPSENPPSSCPDEHPSSENSPLSGQVFSIEELEELATASRTPREAREAAAKLGSRFSKMVGSFGSELSRATAADSHERRQRSYAIAYGEFCALKGIDRNSALGVFIFAQTSAQVTTCVKTVPLSQTVGQGILVDFHPLFEELLARVDTLTSDDLFRSAPGFDIRAMQHERLYSRLYMS